MTDGTADSLEGCPNFEVASVWLRLLAGVVDWVVAIGWGLLVAGIVSIVLAAVLTVISEYSFGVNLAAALLYFGLLIAFMVMIFRHLAVGFRVASKGDTVGHRLFKLRIVAVDGCLLGRDYAVVRQFLGSPLLFGYISPIVLFYIVVQMFNINSLVDAEVYWIYWGWILSAVLAVANHVWMVFDAKGRGWHDWVARAVVVKAER